MDEHITCFAAKLLSALCTPCSSLFFLYRYFVLCDIHFRDRVEVLVVSVPLSPMFGRIQPCQGLKLVIPTIRSNLSGDCESTVVKIRPHPGGFHWYLTFGDLPPIMWYQSYCYHCRFCYDPLIYLFIYHLFFFHPYICFIISYIPLKPTKNHIAISWYCYFVFVAFILLLVTICVLCHTLI